MNYLIKGTLILALGCVFFSLQAKEKTVHLSSQNKQFILIELFTSQGCSSCPPAEKWLNQFIKDKELWEKYIPVAFHVDYWDYLGWKDPYSKSHFTQRQRRYRRERKIRSVYTPGVVVNGKEWRGGRLSPAKKTSSFLQASIQDNKIVTSYTDDQKNLAPKNLELHFVLLGFGIKTAIKSGENARRTLPQEFVVLRYLKMNSKNASWSFDLPARNHKEVQRYAVAMWVNEKGNLKPLQAVGDWL